MDRRGFFRAAFKRTSEEVVKHVDARVEQRASRWIRPPYAIDELEFLLACTRCGDCTEACPHDVIFPLSARLGAQIVGTPAMDLLNKGCQLCRDWPCVTACTRQALLIPEPEEEGNSPALPLLASATINTDVCFPYSGPECGACEASCPVPGALLWDEQRPYIDSKVCVGCGLCREACIMQPRAINIESGS